MKLPSSSLRSLDVAHTKPTGTDAAAPLQVLCVASEMFPLIKTGGLADVVGALPRALAPHGVQVHTLLPGYPVVTGGLQDASEHAVWTDFFGGTARLLSGHGAGSPLFVLDAPHLFQRAGNPYLAANGHDWPDNAERFAALSSAAARIGWGDAEGYAPDLIHAHDWQAALVPAYLHYLGRGRKRPRTMLTLHNIAFQGRFNSGIWNHLGLPEAAFAMEGLEFHGDIGYLKAGIHFADAITTVSPSYAQEICITSGGMGLDSMLRWRRSSLSGIVNGIDTTVWNPATDHYLAQTYDAARIAQRAPNKRAVETHFGLPANDGMLVCMVTRLTSQKGIDLVVLALDAIVGCGARLVVLGSGDAALESALKAGALRHPDRVAVQIGYDEGLSHLLQGGCDAILVPSRFEPCGLTQLCGLRYGCVPIVSSVGGLADTVIDANFAALKAKVATGVQFSSLTAEGLVDAVSSAESLYRQPAVWRAMQTAGMSADVGWDHSAADYAALYRSMLVAPLAAGTPQVQEHT